MILEGTSLQGTMHQQCEMENQDAFRMEKIGEYYAAVVCDGVSLKSDRTFSNSEIASNYCADYVMEFLKEKLYRHMDSELTENTLYECFKKTALSLEEYLEEKGIPFYDCQTTVLLMLWRKGVLYSALAGDGGIIFRFANDSYGMLVTKIKTSPSVEPICYPQGWRFATVNEPDNPVVAAILATDGVFDAMIQVFHEEVTLNEPLIQELFALDQIYRPKQQKAVTEIAKRVDSHDDKTVVVLIAEPEDLPRTQSNQMSQDSETDSISTESESDLS